MEFGDHRYRTYETWDEYVAWVGDQIVSLSLPHAYTVDAQGNSVDIGVVTTAQNIVGPQSDDLAQSMLTLVSIDSSAATTESGFDSSIASMVPAYGSTVYMTAGRCTWQRPKATIPPRVRRRTPHRSLHHRRHQAGLAGNRRGVRGR